MKRITTLVKVAHMIASIDIMWSADELWVDEICQQCAGLWHLTAKIQESLVLHGDRGLLLFNPTLPFNPTKNPSASYVSVQHEVSKRHWYNC